MMLHAYYVSIHIFHIQVCQAVELSVKHKYVQMEHMRYWLQVVYHIHAHHV